MTHKVFLQPRPGVKVRMPENSGHLPADGQEVALSLYWRRRIQDGDVVEARAPKMKPATAAADAQG